MNEPFAKLVEDVQRYEEEVYPNLYPDYAAVFGERIRALGERELLVYLFRTFADSTLQVLLRVLSFAWRDIPFDTWLRILEDVADDRRFVYQFLMFLSDTLGIDVRCLPSSSPNVQRELKSVSFRDGGPRPLSKATRARLDDQIDYESVWKRLASEGAPMLEGLDEG